MRGSVSVQWLLGVGMLVLPAWLGAVEIQLRRLSYWEKRIRTPVIRVAAMDSLADSLFPGQSEVLRQAGHSRHPRSMEELPPPPWKRSNDSEAVRPSVAQTRKLFFDRPLQEAETGNGLNSPLFVLSNGVQDDQHATPEAQAAMLKALGYDGIGPSGTKGIPEMLQALDAQGLKMYALYVGANLDPDQPKYEPGLPEAIRQLKGRETFIWLYLRSAKHKPSSDTGDPRAVEIVREVAEMAEQSGLRVALYPHTWFYVQRVEDAVRLAKKVDRKNVGVTFNLCHWLKLDGPKNMRPLLELAWPHLYVVTINGADADGKDWDQLIQTLDRGTFDVGAFLKTLQEIGYTGPIGLQCYGIQGDKYENLRRSMEAWRKLSAAVGGVSRKSDCSRRAR